MSNTELKTDLLTTQKTRQDTTRSIHDCIWLCTAQQNRHFKSLDHISSPGLTNYQQTLLVGKALSYLKSVKIQTKNNNRYVTVIF